jgi:hypothetical protein
MQKEFAMQRHAYQVCRPEFLLALILISTACCGCLLSGDRIMPTQQKLRCTILASGTAQPISGALVTSSFLSGHQDQPRPISKTDEREMERTASLREANTGATGQDGQVEIVCFTSSDPGWIFGLDKRWNDVTGKHWGFRVEAQNQREYFSIFPMRPGAVGVGDRFTVRIDEIGPPARRSH